MSMHTELKAYADTPSELLHSLIMFFEQERNNRAHTHHAKVRDQQINYGRVVELDTVLANLRRVGVYTKHYREVENLKSALKSATVRLEAVRDGMTNPEDPDVKRMVPNADELATVISACRAELEGGAS